MGGGIGASFVEDNISQLKNTATQVMHANIGLLIFCKTKEDALNRFSIEFVALFIRYMDMHLAPENSQVCN